jgi:16S rRNA (uracil1498-N3)-methyltransferase
MRLHRFYVSQPLGEVVVTKDVSIIKQWLKVFRYKEGNSVILFNGDGNNVTYELTETSLTSCSLKRTSTSPSFIPSRKSFLFISLIKKDLFELVVEKATECGITDIVPILTDHTEKKNIDTNRLEIISKEASEQSGRGDVVTIHPIHQIKEAFLLASSEVTPDNIYVTTLFGKKMSECVQEKNNTSEKTTSIAFFVGPEGGWSPVEETFFETESCTRISLGETTLRAETAGITCAILSSIV